MCVLYVCFVVGVCVFVVRFFVSYVGVIVYCFVSGAVSCCVYRFCLLKRVCLFFGGCMCVFVLYLVAFTRVVVAVCLFACCVSFFIICVCLFVFVFVCVCCCFLFVILLVDALVCLSDVCVCACERCLLIVVIVLC